MRHAYPCAGTPPSARLPLQPSQRASVARSAQIARDLRQHRARPGFLRQAADDGLFRLARHPRAALAALLRAAEMQNQPFSARADHGAEVAPLAGFHLVAGIAVDGEVEIVERQGRGVADRFLGRREEALLHSLGSAGAGLGVLAAGHGAGSGSSGSAARDGGAACACGGGAGICGAETGGAAGICGAEGALGATAERGAGACAGGGAVDRGAGEYGGGVWAAGGCAGAGAAGGAAAVSGGGGSGGVAGGAAGDAAGAAGAAGGGPISACFLASYSSLVKTPDL